MFSGVLCASERVMSSSAAADREYCTPIGTIAEAALLAQQLPPNPQIQRLQYLTQRALVQLNGQHLVSSTQNFPLRFEHHGETMLISRTPRGGLRTGGTTVASATRATRPHVTTMNKKYNNLLANLATSMVQGLRAKLHSRPAFTMLRRSTSGRRSMMATMRSVLSKQGEGTVSTSTTMTMITTASPPSPPTSLTNPIPRSSNQLESPSTMASRTHASGSDATPLLSRFQRDPTPPKLSTSR
jgi:hypothetical protein